MNISTISPMIPSIAPSLDLSVLTDVMAVDAAQIITEAEMAVQEIANELYASMGIGQYVDVYA